MPRPKKKEPEQMGDPFAVLFTSLAVILLAFFILLNSMASANGSKRLVALGSLVGSFGIMSGGLGLNEKGKMLGRDAPMGVQDENALFAAFKRQVRDLGVDASLENEGGRWVLRLREDLLFKKGYTQISPAYFPLMDRIAEVAIASRRQVLVRGFADGGPHYAPNWEISAGRAAAVARFLVEADQVPSKQIKALGYGDVAPGNKKLSGPAARRVEVVFQ